MGVEFYVRYVGNYDGRDRETENKLTKVGFRRLKIYGEADQFWLSSLLSARGPLQTAINKKTGDEAQKEAALSWIKENARAGQIAVVEEMWGAGID